MPAELALAARVVRPDARRGHAGDVRAHHPLDGQRLALDRDRHRGIRHGDQVVRRDVLRLLHPPRGQLVQDLALEGQGAEHAIEGADPIRRHEDAAAITGSIAVAYLALDLLAELVEVGAIERAREARAERLGRDRHDDAPASASARSTMASHAPSA